MECRAKPVRLGYPTVLASVPNEISGEAALAAHAIERDAQRMPTTPALYFPYIHVRDEDWLKSAALYWPSVRRLVPAGYPKRDSSTARTFAQAGVLIDEDPEEFSDLVGWDLVTYLHSNADELGARYHVGRVEAEDWPTHETRYPSDPSSQLGWIHVTKFAPGALEALEDHGIAVRGRDNGNRFGHGRDWIGLHPHLAGAYMTALAGKVSDAAHFQPLTDQNELNRATSTTEVTDAVRLLTGAVDETLRDANGDAVATYVMLAVEVVRPVDLASVDAETIVKCRDDLQDELETFRAYVEHQIRELVEIASTPSERHRAEAFNAHVERTVERPLAKLEQGLALHHIPSARSMLMASSYCAPMPVAVALDQLGANGAVTAGGTVASAFGLAWWGVARQRAAAKEASPVGYLLDVRDRLTPHTVLRRAKRLYTGTY